MINILVIKQNKIFRNIIFSLVVVVIMTAISLSSVLYINFESMAIKASENYAVEGLSQLSFSANFMMDTAKNTVMQYYLNPSTQKLLNSDKLDSFEVSDLIRGIDNVRITSPYISSLYLFNRRADVFYCNSNLFSISKFPDKDILKQINSNKIKKLYPIHRKAPSSIFFGQDFSYSVYENVYSFVLFESSSEKIDRAIILNVSEDRMKTLMKAMSAKISKETLILNTKGDVILGNDFAKSFSNIKKSKIFSKVLNSNDKTGFYFASDNGKKYLLSFVNSDNLDWKYISVTPYEDIIGSMRKIKQATLLIGFLVIVLVGIASYLISKRLYRPVKSMINDLENLQKEQNSNLDEKKRQFLMKFLAQSSEIVYLEKAFNDNGVNLNVKEKYRLILVKIDRYVQFLSKYKQEEREIVVLGIIRLTNELIKSVTCNEIIDMQEGNIAIVTNNFEENLSLLEKELVMLQENIESKLQISISLCIGEISSDYSQIHTIYNKCYDAMNYRLFYGYKSLIYSSKIEAIKINLFIYPHKEISALIDSLLLCKKDEVHFLYKEIINSTYGYSYTELQIIVINLVMGIKNAVDKYDRENVDIGYNDFYEVITNI